MLCPRHALVCCVIILSLSSVAPQVNYADCMTSMLVGSPTGASGTNNGMGTAAAFNAGREPREL